MTRLEPSPVAARSTTPTSRARTRDVLMVTLTLLTGATDAIAFTRLGGVFTSVMTGNMVLLGMDVGHGHYRALEHALLAVVAFIAGTVGGTHVAGSRRADDALWPRGTTRALGAELVLFVVVAVAWWSSGSHPTGALQTWLLVLSALALGVQSSAVLRLGVSGLSTTYLTGTLTTLVSSVTATRSLRGNGRSAGILLALIAGAVLGAVLTDHVPVLAPLVSLVLLPTVIAVAVGVLED